MVVTGLSLGFAHGACVTATGELYTWGFNEEGQLGLGHEANQFSPCRVSVQLANGDMMMSTEERGDMKLRVLEAGEERSDEALRIFTGHSPTS